MEFNGGDWKDIKSEYNQLECLYNFSQLLMRDNYDEFVFNYETFFENYYFDEEFYRKMNDTGFMTFHAAFVIDAYFSNGFDS